MKVNCFACWKMMRQKGAILFSPPIEPTSSDNVDTIQKFHLCSKCFPFILNFIMGKEAPDYKQGMATLKQEIQNHRSVSQE